MKEANETSEKKYVMEERKSNSKTLLPSTDVRVSIESETDTALKILLGEES